MTTDTSKPAESSPPAAELKFDWPEYIRLIEQLAQTVEKGYRPDQIIGISSGGLLPATILAKYFDAPLAVIAAQSYCLGATGLKDAKGKVRLGHNLASPRPELGRRILLVDDLTDSGETLTACVKWLYDLYASRIDELRTAVIWHKASSVWRPDYFASLIEPNATGQHPWIIQPFEKYEQQAAERAAGKDISLI